MWQRTLSRVTHTRNVPLAVWSARSASVWVAVTERLVVKRSLIVVFCVAFAGCATSFRDHVWLDRELLERTGGSLRGSSEQELPPNVHLDDGLDEAEVASIALWRDPSLRAEVTRIDAAFATLDEARRPANPQLSVMGPFGPVSAVATLLVPLESLWQIPARTEAAAREADVAGEAVLMRALDLVRDARLLHVELGLAGDRVLLRTELETVALEVARIAAVRASVGDISPMEERVLSADARSSTDASDSAGTDLSLARARLVARLAIDGADAGTLRATFGTDIATPPGLAELVAIARAARPDARSAELAIAAASARAGWERSRAFVFGAMVEGHWAQSAGPALRLGGRAELPIFGANPGGVGRAEAEAERVLAMHEVVARSVLLDVTVAHARLVQATRSRHRFEVEVLPALEDALQIATRSFESGDTNYLVVLDVLRRAGEARVRRAEFIAEQRRALCELDRAIGARLARAPAVAARVRQQRDTQ